MKKRDIERMVEIFVGVLILYGILMIIREKTLDIDMIRNGIYVGVALALAYPLKMFVQDKVTKDNTTLILMVLAVGGVMFFGVYKFMIIGASVPPVVEGENATIVFRWEESPNECQSSCYALFLDGERKGCWCGTPSSTKNITVESPTLGKHGVFVCGGCYDDSYYEQFGSPCDSQVTKGADWDLISPENCKGMSTYETVLYVIPATTTTVLETTTTTIPGPSIVDRVMGYKIYIIITLAALAFLGFIIFGDKR